MTDELFPTPNEPDRIEIVEPRALISPAMALTEQLPRLFEIAAAKGREGVEILERLMALQRQLEERQAAKDFDAAMARFKASCPPIPRGAENAQFKVSRDGVMVARRYAALEDIEATVRGPLGECGLSFRWGDSVIAGGMLTMPCIVSHVGGHSKSSAVTLPVESRAGCSEQQKYGTAMTYLQRYSLIQALGLTTCDEDDDANAEDGVITPDQVDVLESIIEQCPPATLGKLLTWQGVQHITSVRASQFDACKSRLERTRDAK